MRRRTLVVVGLALLASLVAHLWGMERNLPDGLDVDEDVLFRPAMRMVADGNLNPGWFGYPASTVIYPLAALLHVQQAAFHGGRWGRPDATLRVQFFAGDFARWVRTGRLLSIAYGVASVALGAWIAWTCFGPGTAAVAAVLAAASPVAVEYAQTLRSDSAATFFGLLFLGLALRARTAPTRTRQAAAGAALGLAVASRYMMATTGLVLAVVQLEALRERRSWPAAVRGAVIAALAAAAAFFAVTPYMLLDARNAWHGVVVAARKQSVHVGIEPLGFVGNLAFYFLDALPQALGRAQYALAIAACVVLALRRDRQVLLLALYVVAFVAGVSALGIHWQRWAMPALPVLAILAARAIVGATASVARRSLRCGMAVALAAAATIAVAWQPAREVIENARRNARPSTEIVALDWVLANLPDGAHVAYEWYTAPLTAARARPKRFRLLALTALARRQLAFYRREGWEYLLASTAMYGRYTRDPEHHPQEVEFYRRLGSESIQLHQVLPTKDRRGPIVTIYRLPPSAGATAATPSDAAARPSRGSGP